MQRYLQTSSLSLTIQKSPHYVYMYIYIGHCIHIFHSFIPWTSPKANFPLFNRSKTNFNVSANKKIKKTECKRASGLHSNMPESWATLSQVRGWHTDKRESCLGEDTGQQTFSAQEVKQSPRMRLEINMHTAFS